MKKSLGVILAVLCLSVFSFTKYVAADEASHSKAAEDFLLLMKVPEQLDEFYTQMMAMEEEQLQSMAPADKAEEVNKTAKDAMESIKTSLSWDKIKNDYIETYTSAFSEAELNELVAFYKSEIGQKYISKIPEVTEKLMTMSERRIQDLLPQIQEKINQAAKDAPAPVLDATPVEKALTP